ncbi:PREDICTED: leukosialin [Galeopterus variegatus]|uniref:Leukosialin n=1 Tax=Galeopterus variegatus TaxID=482537 RepID=A0ABM0RVX7_GALVR|nr:PREDICTED: leukosialin [Galeopterus variegatus]
MSLSALSSLLFLALPYKVEGAGQDVLMGIKIDLEVSCAFTDHITFWEHYDIVRLLGERRGSQGKRGNLEGWGVPASFTDHITFWEHYDIVRLLGERSPCLLMPVALEMALFLLLFGGFWAQMVSPQSPEYMATLQTSPPGGSSASLVSDMPEALNLNSVTATGSAIRDPKVDSTGDQISTPLSTTDNEEQIGTSFSASTGPPEPTTSQEVSYKKSSVLLETSSDSAVPIAIGSHTVMGGHVTPSPLETSSGASGPPVTTATSALETSSGATGPPVITVTSALETSSGASGPPVITATSALETSSGASGPPVTTATNVLETSSGASGPPVTTAATTSRASGPPATPAMSTLPTANSHQGSKGMMLVAVLVALLVVLVLVVLLLLWRRWQKRRTGVLTLNGGGKPNGVVDAWAGPARVPDEEAVTAIAGGSGGHKGSGVPEGEGSGQRPLLTTFFGRRKSRQGSLALEELKCGSGSSFKGEEEPLVGREDGAEEEPAAEGPQAGEAATPPCS